MKRKLLSCMLVAAILFSYPTWAETPEGTAEEPNAEETVELLQEQVNGQFGQSQFTTIEIPEAEQQQKEAEILARMEQEREQRRQRVLQEQEFVAGNDHSNDTYEVRGTMPEDPFTDAIGGYTIISGERLTLDMEFEGHVKGYINSVTEQIDNNRGNNASLYTTYIRYDAEAENFFYSTYQIYHPYNLSGVYLQSFSVPEDVFLPEGNDYYASKSGWHKISLKYKVYEYEQGSIQDYYTYDLNVPVDVFVMGTENFYRDLWQVDGHVQDWFYQWLKECVGDYWRYIDVNPMVEDYLELDYCDLRFRDYYPRFDCSFYTVQKPTNTDGSPKKIPAIIQFMSIYFRAGSADIILKDQDIYGNIPDAFYSIDCPELWINLSNNHLTGSFPSVLRYMPQKREYLGLLLNNNKLTGTLPTFETGPSTYSIYLAVEGNQFTDVQQIVHTPTDASIHMEYKNNFLPQSKIQQNILPYVGGSIQPQYQFTHKENRPVEVIANGTVTTDSLKEYVQITLGGIEQDWSVASDLELGIIPGAEFLSVMEDRGDGVYRAKADGTGTAWFGFVQTKDGISIPKNSTVGTDLSFSVHLTPENNIVRKEIVEGEVFSVVVSGSNLQDILNRTFAVAYSADDLELLDAYAPTLFPDLTVGLVTGSNMNITAIQPGLLSFKLEPVMGNYSYWGGIATVVKFRAKRTITTTITLQ